MDGGEEISEMTTKGVVMEGEEMNEVGVIDGG